MRMLSRTPHRNRRAVVLDSISIVDTCDRVRLCAVKLAASVADGPAAVGRSPSLDRHCRAPGANVASGRRADEDHACVSQAFSEEALAFQDRIAVKSGLEWGKTALPPVCSQPLWTELTLL